METWLPTWAESQHLSPPPNQSHLHPAGMRECEYAPNDSVNRTTPAEIGNGILGNEKLIVEVGQRMRVSFAQRDACSLLTSWMNRRVEGRTVRRDKLPVVPLVPVTNGFMQRQRPSTPLLLLGTPTPACALV